MIKVLIVEDSKAASELLSQILKSDPEIDVIGIASSGEDALSMIQRNLPGVITMDIILPGINGFETTQRIMKTTPLPIIIVSSSYTKENTDLTFRAIEAGAISILEKPAGPHNPFFEKMKSEFIGTVKLMSRIKIGANRDLKLSGRRTEEPYVEIKLKNDIDVIAIGASTGGPKALQKFLQEIGPSVTTPMLIVQHITPGFTMGFASWLSSTCGLNVKLAVHGEKIEKSTVYVAPDGLHMGVDGSGCIVLSNQPPIIRLRPAVSFLFKSVAEIYGPRAIGVLLTGMGRDGADELKLMKDKGAVTFAQNEESCIVYGMPGEAVKICGAVCVMTPEDIAAKISEIIKKREEK